MENQLWFNQRRLQLTSWTRMQPRLLQQRQHTRKRQAWGRPSTELQSRRHKKGVNMRMWSHVWWKLHTQDEESSAGKSDSESKLKKEARLHEHLLCQPKKTKQKNMDSLKKKRSRGSENKEDAGVFSWPKIKSKYLVQHSTKLGIL